MKIKYTNPYIKHPETLERLRDYIERSKPVQQPDPLVNFIEEWREPLLSQQISTDKKGTASTGLSWMPTGKQLENLTASINDNLQVINQIQKSAEGTAGVTNPASVTGTSYFNVSGAKSYFNNNTLETPDAAA